MSSAKAGKRVMVVKKTGKCQLKGEGGRKRQTPGEGGDIEK